MNYLRLLRPLRALRAMLLTPSKKRSPIWKGRQPHPFPPCGEKLLTAGLATTLHFLVHIVLLLCAVNFTGLLSRLSGGADPHINILVLQSAASTTGFFSAQFFGGDARLVSFWCEW